MRSGIEKPDSGKLYYRGSEYTGSGPKELLSRRPHSLSGGQCQRMSIKDGVIAEQGETEKVIGDPQDGYTKSLLSSIITV